MTLVKKRLVVAIAGIVLTPVLAQAEIETSMVLQNETSVFLHSGQRTGLATSVNDDREGEGGDLMKFENNARVFFNGDLGEESSWHGELNFVIDTKAIDGYEAHADYTQNDWLRELYADTNAEGWDLRLGKQQVVWDSTNILNPTDYRELHQNAMADARIPVWMINAERNIGATSNVQFIVSQAGKNKIPGLDADGDSGHPFIMKGTDSITGQVNGFLNIAPELGNISGVFFNSFGAGPGLNAQTGTTVQNYVDGAFNGSAAGLSGVVNSTGARTNLIDGTNWDQNNPNSAFEYMSNTTFATFDTFVGATSTYRTDTPDDPANLGLRFRNTLNSGLNYSVNYLYAYDPNPSVGIHWENSAGERLNVVTTTTNGTTTVDLQDSNGNAYGGLAGRAATLVLEESHYRSHYLGFSFDTAIDTSAGPVALNGEILYQKDARVPVVDRTKLGYGDLAGGLQTGLADMLKYHLGGDITLGRNTLLSGQVIQTVNLDYVDDNAGCSEANCGRYTADPATMHLSNGLQKGNEYDTFVALMLSKPFGESELGRVENLLMYEQDGGYWNKLSTEYSLSDEVVLTGEVNLYFGDENTTFGQFENSSNAQVGVKWILE